MFDHDPRTPYLLALLVIGFAALFSLPLLFQTVEQNDVSYTLMINRVVEWAVTVITFSLLAIFAFREASAVLRDTGETQELRYSFFAFMIMALFAVAGLFRFGESIAGFIGEVSAWKLIVGFAAGFFLLRLRRLPYFGDMLYASLLVFSLGAVVFSCFGAGAEIFPIMVTCLMGMLVHVATVNVIEARKKKDAVSEVDEIFPATRLKHKEDRRGSKSEAA